MKKRAGQTRTIGAAVILLLLLLCACGKAVPASESTAAPEAAKTTAAQPAETTPAPGETPADGNASGNESGTGALPVSTEAGTTAAPEPTTEAEPVSVELVLASFNIKYGAQGLENVAAAIRDVSPDIIGLQEVDVGCGRSGNVDEPAELAKLAGYPYYAFAKAIPLGSGEYGTALLSRYPIEFFEVMPLDSGNNEQRSLGHAVIDIEGLMVDVFVTHLSYEDRSLRIGQMKTIAGLLKGCSRYILLGDLNCFTIEDLTYLEAAWYVNRADRRYQTFHYRNSSPDNIVVSEGFTELSSGVLDADVSDHKLLYASFLLTGE